MTATTSPHEANSRFVHPTKACDLVMKGGVTSGVVYPPVVVTMAEQYRFCSIGGTSAGAIAAAATAAAEYGRERSGFQKLEAISTWLGSDDHLLNLFQPTTEARPLMKSAQAALEARQKRQLNWRRGLSILETGNPSVWRSGKQRGRRWGTAFGVGVALIITIIASVVFAISALVWGTAFPGLELLALAAVLALLLGAIGWLAGGWIWSKVASGLDLWRIATKVLPQQGFGLCGGLPVANDGSPALTQWMCEHINDIAGLPPKGTPLTFADLAKRKVDGECHPIDLRLVTTNLSHSRPYVFPLLSPLDQTRFIFNEAEFRTYFPDEVVTYLTTAAARQDVPLPEGYNYLPNGNDLPVAVATRLSPSFPVLLSAVPLYTLTYPALERYKRPRSDQETFSYTTDDLQINWFSDGGISSNFPIHFFDDWLPSRPTFGITLSSHPDDAFVTTNETTTVKPEKATTTVAPMATEDMAEESEPIIERSPIYLAKANRPQGDTWKEIRELGPFAHAIWTTAQNYRDNTQAVLPSYRDRVVHIRLRDDEGGLNLTMGPKTIEGMAVKGREAGAILNAFPFDHHRWVRFLVLMNLLEGKLHGLREDYVNVEYAALLAAIGKPSSDPAFDPELPYRNFRDAAWCAEASLRLDELMQLVERWDMADQTWQASHEEWDGKRFFAHQPPQPDPVLRISTGL